MSTIIIFAVAVLGIFALGSLVHLYISTAEIPRSEAKHMNAVFIVAIAIIGIALALEFAMAMHLNKKPTLNSDLPDDMYYLGVQAVDSWIDSGKYYYEFGCPDSMEMPHEGITYIWESTSPLYIDYPYMLTMDSMGTKDVEDDEIVCIWRLIE